MSESTSSPLAADRKGADDAPIGVEPGKAGTTFETSSADAGSGSLCGVLPTTCTPDDDGRQGLGEQQSCATPVGDGGLAQGKMADASTADYACRVAASGPPHCPLAKFEGDGTSNADRNGVDGVACQTDSQCAPGFDCVAAGPGEKSNVCRRYCCSASCEGVTAHNGGPTFCDVRSVVRSEASPSDSPLIAPVCMPIKTCTLLKEGECTDGETCAIVNDRGATGCVPTDKQNAKESCEKKHCAAGFTCLGSPGDRTCYRLCRTTGGTECGENEVCTTGSAFADTSYGVCKSTE